MHAHLGYFIVRKWGAIQQVTPNILVLIIMAKKDTLNLLDCNKMASCSRFIVLELPATPHQPSAGFVFP